MGVTLASTYLFNGFVPTKKTSKFCWWCNLKYKKPKTMKEIVDKSLSQIRNACCCYLKPGGFKPRGFSQGVLARGLARGCYPGRIDRQSHLVTLKENLPTKYPIHLVLKEMFFPLEDVAIFNLQRAQIFGKHRFMRILRMEPITKISTLALFHIIP